MAFPTAPKSIYINLPIKSLSSSIAFYTSLGFVPNPKFSDATTMCMVVSPHINIMLLEHEKFKLFAPSTKVIADAKTSAQVLIFISMDSRYEVDKICEEAEKAGGKKDPCNKQEMEGMYGRSFEDLDGHVWEVGCMGPAANAK